MKSRNHLTSGPPEVAKLQLCIGDLLSVGDRSKVFACIQTEPESGSSCARQLAWFPLGPCLFCSTWTVRV